MLSMQMHTADRLRKPCCLQIAAPVGWHQLIAAYFWSVNDVVNDFVVIVLVCQLFHETSDNPLCHIMVII